MWSFSLYLHTSRDRGLTTSQALAALHSPESEEPFIATPPVTCTISHHPTETFLPALYICSLSMCQYLPPSDLEGTSGLSSGMTSATGTLDPRPSLKEASETLPSLLVSVQGPREGEPLAHSHTVSWRWSQNQHLGLLPLHQCPSSTVGSAGAGLGLEVSPVPMPARAGHGVASDKGYQVTSTDHGSAGSLWK